MMIKRLLSFLRDPATSTVAQIISTVVILAPFALVIWGFIQGWWQKIIFLLIDWFDQTVTIPHWGIALAVFILMVTIYYTKHIPLSLGPTFLKLRSLFIEK